MTPSRQQFLSWIAVAASLALFLASLGLPALEFATREPVRGCVALCWGWWGVLTGDFPWFANPLYFAALTLALMRKRAMSQLLCVLALGVGMLSLRVRAWWFDESKATPVEKLGPAFFFWMASFLVLFLLLFFVRTRAPVGSRAPV